MTALWAPTNNKYFAWYRAICDRARSRELEGYGEKHHVIARAFGGGGRRRGDIVNLTFREHFLCHWLLVKFLDEEAKAKMAFALWQMTFSKGGRTITGWQYEIGRRANKRAFGKTHSSEARRKISEKMSDIMKQPEVRRKISEKMSGSNNPMFGKIASLETRRKMSEKKRGNNNPMKRPGARKKVIESVKASWAKRKQSGPITLSVEHRRKISEANKGAFTAERRQSLRDGWARRRLKQQQNELTDAAQIS
jgi:NUMOD3 motif